MASDDKYKKIFSKNLNYFMNLKGKTQTDIINDLDINKSAISSWCNGTRLPRMDAIGKLADYFHINISDLIGNTIDNNYFEYIAEDDLMFPILDIGDRALIYKQNKIDCDDAFYLIKLDGKMTIRRIIISKDESYYTLMVRDPNKKPIDIPKNEVYKKIQILGKVIKAENESAFKTKGGKQS